MSISPESTRILLIILVAVGAILAISDAVIFFRWVKYLWAKYDFEEQYREALARAEQQDDGEVVVKPYPAFAYRPPRYPFARTWSLVDPYLAFQLVFIGGQFVIALAMLPLMMWLGAGAITSGPGIILQTVGIILLNGLFVGVTAFCIHRYGASLRSIGLGKPTARQLAIGLGLGFTMFLVSTGAESGLGMVLPKLLPKPVMDGLTQFTKDVTAGGMFIAIPSVPLKILFALAGAIAAPIGEEVFFRGLLYNSLKRRINIPVAIVLSGLAFALVHIGPLAIIIIFPMGMLLAYVYEKTGSLWVTICMHAAQNGLTFALALAFPHLGEPAREPARPAPPPHKAAITRSVTPPSPIHPAARRPGAR